MGILSLLLWTPAAGALLLAFTPHHNFKLIRTLANFLRHWPSCYLAG